jgi:hypothetical protein
MRSVIEAPLPPTPGEERSAALALVNTRTTQGGLPADALETPTQVGRWLAEHEPAPVTSRSAGLTPPPSVICAPQSGPSSTPLSTHKARRRTR